MTLFISATLWLWKGWIASLFINYVYSQLVVSLAMTVKVKGNDPRRINSNISAHCTGMRSIY